MRVIWTVFALSVGLLAFEIGLMRVLLYTSWHHFAFLVISIVLLGFGASGTALCFRRQWLVANSDVAVFVLVVATAVSMPIVLGLSQHIPVEARFIPAMLLRQSAAWVAYWVLLSFPFFLGASAVGLALMTAGRGIPAVYAANLTGSALGAVLVTATMHVLGPAWLGVFAGAVVLLGALPARNQPARWAAVIGCVIAAGVWLVLDPPTVRVDPYKYQSYVNNLVDGGKASKVARAHGPRAVVEVYRGDVFHEIPFLDTGTRPPRLYPVIIDGHWAGSILHLRDIGDAEVAEHTLMAVPYELVSPRPRVLLLGETGGVNTWLALRKRSTSVDVVQPNRELLSLVSGPLRDNGGLVFDLPGVSIHVAEPRHFVAHTSSRFDLIQLVSLESWAAESGGIGGLNQDYLVTVEGLTACLRRLQPDGVLSICRGIQLPPRDNVKLLATLIDALHELRIDEPDRHVVMVRDYLAVCILVKASPWSSDDIDNVRAICKTRSLTPVYFIGIDDDELNHPDKLPGPPGHAGDWLHHASTMLFSAEADRYVDTWPFDIRPPTDDRPFFANFCKLGSIGKLRALFGDLWLTRVELALLFVLAATVIVAIIGLAVILFPLMFIPALRGTEGLISTAVYFAAIGLGYLMLEITLLSKLIHLLGDPVQAGAATIAGFLFFSGLGSLAAQRIERVSPVRWVMVAIVGFGIVQWALLGWITSLAGAQPLPVRFLAALVVIAPLGFLMGVPMPSALRRLQRGAPQLIPWAWGINGFASVLAPPLATAIGMMWGFRLAGGAALCCYFLASMLFARLARH